MSEDTMQNPPVDCAGGGEDCPSNRELMQWASGGLTPARRAELQDRVVNCSHCQERLHDWIAEESVEPTGPNPSSGGISQELPAVADVNGRFTMREHFATGGLGEIFVAHDGELNRKVAVKRIRADRDSQQAFDRFQREAVITGQLEHPAIVPVYSHGIDEAGQPYYAMRLIEGSTLASRIEGWHEQRRGHQASPDSKLEFRRLLQHFLVACNAVDYAHRHGVVHRDLKPDNILVGGRGETFVVDWGLAKWVFAPESDVDPTEVRLPERNTDSSGNELTEAGRAFGTLAYMSPEQAHDAKYVGPATDIFALGATLYCLLSGRPPRSGAAAQIMASLMSEEPLTPPKIESSAPAPLRAICERAMHPVADLRYESAAELANDIEAFLADEKVAAYPEHVTATIGRWLRRHRGVTTVAVVAGILLLITAVTGWVVTRQKNQQIIAAQTTADQRFQLARSAVDGFSNLADRMATGDLKRRFHVLSEGYYERFAEDAQQVRSLHREVALARLKTGVANRELGSIEESLTGLEAAERIWRQELEREPDDQDAIRQLAEVLHRKAQSLRLVGRGEDALACATDAVRMRTRLATNESPSSKDRCDLARSQVELSAVQWQHDEELCLETIRKAQNTLDEVWAETPDEPYVRDTRATVYLNLGATEIYFDSEKAASAFQIAIAAAREAFRLDGFQLRHRDMLGRCFANLASLYQSTGNLKDAEQAAGLATTHLAVLLNANPGVVANRQMHRKLLVLHADLLIKTGSIEEAEERLAQASAMFHQLSLMLPSDPAMEIERILLHRKLAELKMANDQLEPAIDQLRECVNICDATLKELPDYEDTLRQKASVLGLLAEALQKAGKTDESKKVESAAFELLSRFAAQ